MAAELSLRSRGRIVCIGFMGAGKSTAARSVADAVGSDAVDVDHLIERRVGKPIEQVFADDGESAFRELEQQITVELLERADGPVISLGGGATSHPRVREALRDHLVIWLDVGLETAWARSRKGHRPLARDRHQFERLYQERLPTYAALADAIVPAERSTAMSQILEALTGLPADAKLIWAASESADYPVYIGSGLVASGGFWPETLAGRRFLVTDGNVGRLYGEALGPLHGRVAIMPGEQSKTVAHAEIIWTELVRAGMRSSDLIVALGGGVVGDLAGFCAATYQRGVRYVQIPTSLVAQVDSAYGGKTGVDLAEAKNYVGAYHQPSAVITDPQTLTSLAPEELSAGYAEVLKTALVAGGELWRRLRAGAEPTDLDVIAACVRTKLRIVAEDERDAGIRQALNLGHTVGHAIETATGYARYRHGEAVALGLLAALRLSELGGLRSEVAELLAGRGLPTRLEGTDAESVIAAAGRDKKRRDEGAVPFVLLAAPGEPRIGCLVESGALIDAVRELEAR